MKKTKLAFIIPIIFIIVAGIVHSCTLYLKWILSSNYTSSAPAEVAFFFVVPYLLVSGLIAVSMVLYKKINAKREEEGFKAINKYFIIPILIVLAVGVINTVYFFIDYIFHLGTQSIINRTFICLFLFRTR